MSALDPLLEVLARGPVLPVVTVKAADTAVATAERRGKTLVWLFVLRFMTPPRYTRIRTPDADWL